MNHMWTLLQSSDHAITRNNAVEEVLCEEKEKRESMPTSDSEILHEKSCSNKHGKPKLVCSLRKDIFFCTPANLIKNSLCLYCLIQMRFLS
jgi:hypothetical protein